ncbi:hypothetical protein BDP27DRAFT_1521683 [Rhodocollybia butyracea]|uniref:Uncharacterized protein n=1 Tax=Rhodocollybia butyracea TaxID=206335 RepID=A0A9P5TVK6_9AGAR|nr:hypothetical protein BDP27DRAFT_1521683 [Rhodocollybia butyracea]
MYSKLAFVTAALATLAVASPLPHTFNPPPPPHTFNPISGTLGGLVSMFKAPFVWIDGKIKSPFDLTNPSGVKKDAPSHLYTCTSGVPSLCCDLTSVVTTAGDEDVEGTKTTRESNPGYLGVRGFKLTKFDQRAHHYATMMRKTPKKIVKEQRLPVHESVDISQTGIEPDVYIYIGNSAITDYTTNLQGTCSSSSFDSDSTN